MDKTHEEAVQSANRIVKAIFIYGFIALIAIMVYAVTSGMIDTLQSGLLSAFVFVATLVVVAVIVRISIPLETRWESHRQAKSKNIRIIKPISIRTLPTRNDDEEKIKLLAERGDSA